MVNGHVLLDLLKIEVGKFAFRRLLYSFDCIAHNFIIKLLNPKGNY